MYSLVMFLAFAGYLLVDDVRAPGRRRSCDWSGIALVTAALLYTHYWAMWLLARGRPHARCGGRGGTPSGATGSPALEGRWARSSSAGILFLPWLPSMLYQSAHTGTPWASAVRPTVAAAFTLSDFGSGLYADGGFFAVAARRCSSLLGRVRAGDRRSAPHRLDLRTRPQLRAEALVAALTFGIGHRHLLRRSGRLRHPLRRGGLPFLALLVAGGRHPLRRPVGAVRCAAGGSAPSSGVGALWNVADTRTQAPGRSAPINANAQPGDLVIYCPDQLGPAGSRAVTADVEQVAYPTLRRPAARRLGRLQGSATTRRTRPAFARRALDEAPSGPGDLRGLERRVQDVRGRLRGAGGRPRCGPSRRPGARVGEQLGYFEKAIRDVVPRHVVIRS